MIADEAPTIELSQATIVIPTYEAGRYIVSMLQALTKQGVAASQILIIDSSSADATAESFRQFGARVVVIPQCEFNHGGTRRYAAELAKESEFLIYLTQDAIPESGSAFRDILKVFSDSAVGMAYGRQLPRPTARAIERHARDFNYPQAGVELRSLRDRDRLGVKSTFCSDSFAAYRRTALESVGSFPEDAFFAEDQIIAGRMLMAGWKLAYVGEACVTHSHDYSIADDFRRCFDVGVYHARNTWLLDTFGRAEGEGARFVLSELRYLLRNEPWTIPSALIRTFAKYAGYRIGRLEHRWPLRWKARLSMAPSYWRTRIPRRH